MGWCELIDIEEWKRLIDAALYDESNEDAVDAYEELAEHCEMAAAARREDIEREN